MKQTTIGRTLQTETDSGIAFHLNPKQAEAINELLATGFWGNTAADCCRRLIDEMLRRKQDET